MLDERRVERYVGHTVLERSARDGLSTTEAVRNKHPFHRFRTELLIALLHTAQKALSRSSQERSQEAATAVDVRARLECG